MNFPRNHQGLSQPRVQICGTNYLLEEGSLCLLTAWLGRRDMGKMAEKEKKINMIFNNTISHVFLSLFCLYYPLYS